MMQAGTSIGTTRASDSGRSDTVAIRNDGSNQPKIHEDKPPLNSVTVDAAESRSPGCGGMGCTRQFDPVRLGSAGVVGAQCGRVGCVKVKDDSWSEPVPPVAPVALRLRDAGVRGLKQAWSNASTMGHRDVAAHTLGWIGSPYARDALFELMKEGKRTTMVRSLMSCCIR